MKNRSVVTIILAVILVLLVMCVAAVFTFGGGVSTEKFALQPAWQGAYSDTQSMKIIDLTGDDQNDLFVQSLDNVRLFDSAGNTLLDQSFSPTLATSMGDLDGDGTDEIVAYAFSGGNPTLTIISKGEPGLEFDVEGLGEPARAAVIRFESGAQIILGDVGGGLASYDPDGALLWNTNLSSGDAIRGLDDARLAGAVALAAANHDGTVTLINDQGAAAWEYFLGEDLRRLRAYDLDGDQTSELLVGGDSGRLVILDAATGAEEFTKWMGQAVTEIREAELDGEPSSQEFVAGGKDGGVWAFKADGSELWSKSVSDKVTEITGVDIDQDGSQEVIIGDESGGVALFSGDSGDRYPLPTHDTLINRIDSGRLSAANQVAIADGEQVGVYGLVMSQLKPLRYAPLLVGLLISALIIGAAWYIASMPERLPQRAAIEDQSVESLQSQRRMLKEGIADVERLQGGGEMTPESYLGRLKELRAQLAENETALRKAGVSMAPETMVCPNCGGVLPLGLDKCEYCGQVVIT